VILCYYLGITSLSIR